MDTYTLKNKIAKKNFILRDLKLAKDNKEINTVYYLRQRLNKLSPSIKQAISILSDKELLVLKLNLQTSPIFGDCDDDIDC